MLVQCSPRAQIVPSEIGGQTEDAGPAFSLGRARFENRIIDADVLAFLLEPAKSSLKLARPISGSNLFEKGRRIRQMLAQRIGHRVRPP